MRESTTMKFQQPEIVGKAVLVLAALHRRHKLVVLTVGKNLHKPALLTLVLLLLSALSVSHRADSWDQQLAISASGWFRRA
jgi:hypothetical protein